MSCSFLRHSSACWSLWLCYQSAAQSSKQCQDSEDHESTIRGTSAPCCCSSCSILFNHILPFVLMRHRHLKSMFDLSVWERHGTNLTHRHSPFIRTRPSLATLLLWPWWFPWSCRGHEPWECILENSWCPCLLRLPGGSNDVCTSLGRPKPDLDNDLVFFLYF